MTVEITIPRPPSVNLTRRYDWANHKSYAAWRNEAGYYINAEHKRIPGSVRIAIAIEDTGRGDLDNFAKQAIDLLVRHGIIDGDSRNIVREIHMFWDCTITGCQVTIEPLANGNAKG